MKSDRITRVVKILTTLQADKNYTADDLADLFGKSKRTIYRDLKELAAIGVPYQFDSKTGGYTIDPQCFLPPVDLNLQEALSLLLLVHRASANMQLPFKRTAQLAAIKIENNLPSGIRKYCNTALQNISTMHNPHTPAGTLDKIFDTLHRAIHDRRMVRMLYDSVFDADIIDLELCPCHMTYNRRAWYVIGRSMLHDNAMRTFKLARVKEASLLDKKFIDDEDFDPTDHFGRAWSMIPEGRLYNVKLRFLPKVARNVAEVLWHSTQKSTWNDDGSVTLEFRVDGINEISWWVLGYGDQVQILTPDCLRQKILTTAKNMIQLNNS